MTAFRSALPRITLVSALLFPLHARAETTCGHASIQVGGQTQHRNYEGTWDEIGIDLGVRRQRWPLELNVVTTRSFETRPCATEECRKIQYSLTQAGFGLAREASLGRLKPYGAAGVGWGEVRRKRIDVDPSSNYPYPPDPTSTSHGFGWWASAGVRARAASHLFLGVGGRFWRVNQDHGPDPESPPHLKIWSAFGLVGWAWPTAKP